MNSDKKIFVETSTIVDYALKPGPDLQIKSIISRYNTIISANYVKMEIKRGVIQYLVYLHNKIVNSAQWSDVQRAVSNLSPTPQRHLLGTVLENLEGMFRHIEGNTLEGLSHIYGGMTVSDYLKKESKSYLRLCIRRSWKKIDEIANEIINPMSCYPDIEPPEKRGAVFENSRRTCDKSNYECNIREFFKANRAKFQQILEKLESVEEGKRDKETNDRVKYLKEILRLLPHNNRKLSNKDGKEKCWKCSDAILAVTAPEDCDVLHHNPKHYNLICEAIGKTSVTY